MELRSVSAGRERVRAPVRDVDIAVVRDLGQICAVRVDRVEVAAFAEPRGGHSENDLLPVGRPDRVDAPVGVRVGERGAVAAWHRYLAQSAAVAVDDPDLAVEGVLETGSGRTRREDDLVSLRRPRPTRCAARCDLARPGAVDLEDLEAGVVEPIEMEIDEALAVRRVVAEVIFDGVRRELAQITSVGSTDRIEAVRARILSAPAAGESFEVRRWNAAGEVEVE